MVQKHLQLIAAQEMRHGANRKTLTYSLKNMEKRTFARAVLKVHNPP